MKSIIKVFGISFCTFLIACTDVEPLGVKIPATQKDLSEVKAFKETEHPMSVAWFKNWKADGNMNTYLNTLPDSLDIVVLEAGFKTPSVLQMKDLSIVQSQKGTKVLILLDLEQWVTDFTERMETAESDAEADVEDAAKEEGREPTQKEFDMAIAIAQKETQETSKTKLNELSDQMVKLVSDNGYDGISLHVSAVNTPFPKECILGTIDKLSAKFGKKTSDKLFILEGNVSYFVTKFGYFNYLIDTSVSLDRLADVQEIYDNLKNISGFDAKKFITFLSLGNESWSKPFSDIISTVPSTEPKYITLALWTPNDGTAIGGMALKAIEKDYERKYLVLRSTLQYLNLK